MAAEDVAKPLNLPPYPEMILAAIDALNEEGGSNKLAISKQIELTHGEVLPEAHQSLLTAHLARMKESGELVFLKNNYFRPGPDAPPKHGRGRPPKPKTDLPPDAADAASPEGTRPSRRIPSPSSSPRPPAVSLSCADALLRLRVPPAPQRPPRLLQLELP